MKVKMNSGLKNGRLEGVRHLKSLQECLQPIDLGGHSRWRGPSGDENPLEILQAGGGKITLDYERSFTLFCQWTLWRCCFLFSDVDFEAKSKPERRLSSETSWGAQPQMASIRKELSKPFWVYPYEVWWSMDIYGSSQWLRLSIDLLVKSLSLTLAPPKSIQRRGGDRRDGGGQQCQGASPSQDGHQTFLNWKQIIRSIFMIFCDYVCHFYVKIWIINGSPQDWFGNHIASQDWFKSQDTGLSGDEQCQKAYHAALAFAKAWTQLLNTLSPWDFTPF